MTMHRDYQGAKMGMWLFLFTEILLFGGLFVLYSVTFGRYPAEFHEASLLLDVTMGTTNTVVLITSSLFAALSVVGLQRGDRRLAQVFMGGTLILACCFLVIKYFEWSHKIHLGIYPGGETLIQWEPGKQAFFALYYVMTGLHGLHVIIGMGVFLWVWTRIAVGTCTPEHYVALENAGLYWHLVDLIWIYLFPLYYLIT
ncbi:MAG: cytochrome c oxidase subunit 3 family protein [Pseudodesulfovibrio sp.]|uniref:cytochrome c oxidase subunit 3 family protein n=1 Tax=Pseudodesulfovibrio sp. TaxID=2035812 RepID=UPI003D0E8BAB